MVSPHEPLAHTDVTAQQVNDLFDSSDLAKAIDTEDFKHFLDHVPIALVVSKLLSGVQRIIYVNKAFEGLIGQASMEVRGRGWSILNALKHEDDPHLALGEALHEGKDCVGTFQLNGPKTVLVEAYVSVIENDDGAILVATERGLWVLKNGHLEPFPPTRGLEFKPSCLLRDHDGGLWVGALVDQGLLHLHNGHLDRFSRSDGLSGNTVPALFEDREGSIWAVTADGLDRFRELAATTISVDQGLSSHAVLSVVAARDGAMWIATGDGLDRFRSVGESDPGDARQARDQAGVHRPGRDQGVYNQLRT